MLKFSKRQVINLLFIATGVLVLGCSTLLINRFYYGDQVPPSYLYSIDEFKKWKPLNVKTDKVILENDVIFIVQGDVARVFPSAKSEYYFDKNGNYINWNMDPGDFTSLPLVNLGIRVKSSIDEIGKTDD